VYPLRLIENQAEKPLESASVELARAEREWCGLASLPALAMDTRALTLLHVLEQAHRALSPIRSRE